MMNLKSVTVLVLLTALPLLAFVGRSSIGRKLLYYPSHRPDEGGLTRWITNGQVIGCARRVESPGTVWLFLHGNAGQASDRLYALSSFDPDDSVYILEYPGYGSRRGSPSRASFNGAAREAYEALREAHPGKPVCVAAESIGSGPASSLAGLAQPPDKFVLIVPFDKLSLVARDHFPSFLVRLFLADDWDNVQALSRYRGPVQIFGAESDTVIPPAHAKALAAAIPGSDLTIIAGGHNDWSVGGQVKIRCP
jgi:pimeloyl-ACP methyl ester carboxylesterase